MSLPDAQLNFSDQDIQNLTNLLNPNPNTEHRMSSTIQAAKEIAHTLKPFNGRPEHLEFFINSVDKFYERYYINTTDESLKEFVIASIHSKIIDSAGDHILCHPELTTWPLIKIELRRKFGDKVNRHTLSQQLNFLTRNKNESVLEFLDRLKILKNRIALKINSEALVQSTKTALIEQTEETAITVLLSNINSELRTILLINKLKDLDDTYTYILNYSLIEQQINSRTQTTRNNFTTQTATQNMQKHRPNNSSFNQSNHFPQPNSNPHNFTNSYQIAPRFPSQPINIQPRPIQQRFPTNREVFGKQTNAFPKNNPNQPVDSPKPMSGVSIQPKRNFSRPPSQIQNNNPNFRLNQWKQNYWRQNPHANPLVFTELTHLENNYPSEEFLNENYTNQPQNNIDNFEQESPEYFDQNDPDWHTTYENSDYYQSTSSSNVPDYYEPQYETDNENFLKSASQKDNPS